MPRRPRRAQRRLEEKTAPSTSGNGIVEHGSDSDSSSSDDGKFEGFVQVEFVFSDPKPDDFHGVQALLQTYLDNKIWDLTGFVDLVLEPTTVGTVIKVVDEDEDEEHIYAFVSALNLGRYKDQKCILELKEYLSKACTEEYLSANLKTLLGDKAHEVGLLVSQRISNLPHQLLPPLYDLLFNEVKDESAEDKSYCFKTYMMISKIYKRKEADKKMVKSGEEAEDIVYDKEEDEIFHQLSSWSFSFPIHGKQVISNKLRNHQQMCLVMAVDASKVPTFQEQWRSLVNESISNDD